MSLSRDPSLGQAINRAARLLRRLADQRLAPLGLSAGYMPVLTALVDGDALSQKALAERAGIEQPTMAATLGRMERDGVIQRQPDPGDKRSARFSLTSATRDKLPKITMIIESINENALAVLGEADEASFRRMLAQVIGALEGALDERGSPEAGGGRAIAARLTGDPGERTDTSRTRQSTLGAHLLPLDEQWAAGLPQ